jgi:hypothetical protein
MATNNGILSTENSVDSNRKAKPTDRTISVNQVNSIYEYLVGSN